MWTKFIYSLIITTLAPKATAVDTYIGNWKLISYTYRNESQQVNFSPPANIDSIVLTLNSDDEIKYQVSLKIANTFRGSLQFTGIDDDIEVLGSLTSTRMLPPPDLSPIEAFVKSEFPQMDEMSVDVDTLTTHGPTASIFFSRVNDADIRMAGYYDSYAGLWTVTDFIEKGKSLTLPSIEKRDIVLNLAKVDNTNYRVSIKIGNVFRGSMTITGKASDASSDVVVMGRLPSTRMKPAAELQPLETFIKKRWPEMVEILFDPSLDSIVIRGPNAKIICKIGY
jgi:hypothetical protein